MKGIYLGIGSSIGDAAMHFARAKTLLEAEGIQVLRQSHVLKNPAWGGVAVNEFTNAVWEVETDLSPRDLLRVCHRVEDALGRTRTVRWEDRIMDIDLLLYGDTCLQEEAIHLPHPGMAQRRFVLEPLRELVGEDFTLPLYGRLGDMLARLEGV